MKQNFYREIKKQLRSIKYIRTKDKKMRSKYKDLSDEYTIGTEQILEVIKNNIKVYVDNL